MIKYKTVTEIASELNITPRHVQYLSRNGKIEGAIKRAGSWFIPEDAKIPIKNTKSGTKGFQFVGTKSKIFDSAIKLFMSRGFNNVSLRDIADSVGIQPSTIYNHFKSKQEILDTIYDFYCYYYLYDRPSIKDIEPILNNGTPMEILKCVEYYFNEDYRQKLTDITKIIFQRIAVDEHARKIGKTLMIDEGIQYVTDVFNQAIKSGNLKPFDTHLMAVFINSLRIFILFNWIMDPDNVMTLMENEQALYKHAINYITGESPQRNGQENP